MELQAFKGENLNELSMVEVAYAILEETSDVHEFTNLLIKIQDYLNLSESELEEKMARFYTDLNIDGRFISLGENRWGLRAWYAIDAIDEEIVNSLDDEDLPRHRRRKNKSKLNAFSDDEDMIDYNDDDPEDVDDIYDQIDEDEVYETNDDDEEDEADEISDNLTIVADEDLEDEDTELGAYASDLDELGTDNEEIDDDFVAETDEDFDDEYDEEDEEEEYVDEEVEED
ncbi:DNA-directed RNA polymerase subunit delta [Eremococcus coleocola]|uniref:DNA-directed RNA polymerase subunit delta n=1 Tax=Eremococcus coleocola TaxID=88132 RepID=UPI0003F7E2CE|nr:DNA-directed RNA polymerase subunit delta [Eremococcus coleocola]